MKATLTAIKSYRKMTRMLLLTLCLVLVIGCESSGGITPVSSTAPASTAVATSRPTPTHPLSPRPGLVIWGHVRLPDGSGLADVPIYRAYAAYSGKLIATTDQTGYYQSEFQYIPGDEMVRVWAELKGYTFGPADEAFSWEPGLYSWRHYYGYEAVTLDFVARPAP